MLRLDDENSAYIELLCGHLRRLTRRLRAIPPEQWEWQPTLSTPCPRFLAQHAWLWLVSDRRHLTEPDATRHLPPPEAPSVQSDLCTLLEEETEQWRGLLRELSPEEFREERFAFNWRRVNVRWLVWHMCQNVIYKHGQLATLYFQLGLDGDDPYQAPLPVNDYDRLTEMIGHPAIHWAVSGPADDTPPEPGMNLDERDRAGCTALHYAVWKDDARKVELLLERGADVNLAYGEGWTPLMDAAWLGHLETMRVLLAHEEIWTHGRRRATRRWPWPGTENKQPRRSSFCRQEQQKNDVRQRTLIGSTDGFGRGVRRFREGMRLSSALPVPSQSPHPSRHPAIGP